MFAKKNATTIDISKNKLMFQEYEKQIHHDNDWREMCNWHRNTIDYRHIIMPAFIRRGGEKCINDAKTQLLSNIVRLRSNQNGQQEREEGEQDMDVE
ncbi:hypothetical protein BJV82DRAFT_608716 [Fennellomyces sp. T-0311]|nr:hypothetical protein BJV82DRAFT_608716 [Fennellomyces sp. T-0311]